MLTVTTIFLGLVAGPQTIELAAGEEIARIELAVGRTPCAALVAPPWRGRCEFGPVPEPQRVVAVGFDREGRELARAERIVNRFRAAAEVAIHLERTSSGVLRARLVAASLADGPPRSRRVELDGIELPAPDPGAVDLPPVDLEIPHLLRAELEWSDTLTAVGETVFGGRHGETIASELTAIAIESEDGPSVAELQGVLATAAGPAQAVAVDEGPADLFVVLDPAAVGPLAKIAGITARDPVGASGFGQPGGARQTRGLAGSNQRFVSTLEKNDRIRIVWPWPERRESDGRPSAAFPPSPPFTSREGGLPWILVRARLPAESRQAPALIDAAAVAGMIADGRERRRAVLVVLGGRELDASRLGVPTLRSYLAAVRVPLFVWRTEARRGDGDDPWGEVVELTSSAKLHGAFRALTNSLARQRIVWIEGSHLPNEVRLVAARTDLRLAGESVR